MRKNTLIFIVFWFISQGINAQFEKTKNLVSTNNYIIASTDSNIPEESTSIGYSKGNIDKMDAIGIKGDENLTLSVAIKIPYTMFNGNSIFAIKIAIVAAASEGKVFISKNLNSTPVYIQNIDQVNIGWNYVILNTPYNITEGDVYIGYSINTSKNALGLETSSINKNADWIRIENEEWNNISMASKGEILGSWGIHAVVYGGDYSNQTQYDGVLESINTSEYVKKKIPFSLSGTILNNGVKTINNFTFHYKIKEEVKEFVIDKIAITNGGYYTVELPQQTFSEEGTYPIEMYITNINNGKKDIGNTNNKKKMQVKCLNNFFPKKILIEQYTGQGCGYCPSGEDAIDNAVKSISDKVVWVSHHIFGIDEFTISESILYANFFGSKNSAPNCSVDRTPNEFSAKNAVVFHPYKITGDMLKNKLKEPAFVTVNIDGYFNSETRILNITIHGEFAKELPNTAKLNVFITQDSIIAKQEGGGLKYNHNHSLRAVLTEEAYGDNIDIVEGKYSKTYTYAIPQKIGNFNCIPEKMYVNAFIANYTESNNLTCEVYNSNKAALTSPSQIDNINQENIKIYTLNSIVYINGKYDKVSIYNPCGALLKEYHNESNIKLEKGLYIIQITNKNQVITNKIVIK